MRLRWARWGDDAPGTKKKAEVQPERPWRRMVLIVEDDPELWPVLERLSTEADPGAVVEFARTPTEAEARLASDVRYDVVLTDYCLPHPGVGDEIADRAEALQPWARVGMISAKLGFHPKDRPYLAKPFTRQSYRRFLRDLLGWHRNSPTSRGVRIQA